MSLMLLTITISLQKVLKNGLNVYKIAKLCIFFWLCDICCHGNSAFEFAECFISES